MAGSTPQRSSCTIPLRAIACVDMVSLGNDARSTSCTSWPAAASSMAVAAPPQRAPTTTTSQGSVAVTSCDALGVVLIITRSTVRMHGVVVIGARYPFPDTRLPTWTYDPEMTEHNLGKAPP